MLALATRETIGSADDGDGLAMAGVRADGLFLPGVDPHATELLLQRLWRQRQASFLAGGLTIMSACSDLALETGFSAAFEAYQEGSVAKRRAMMEHPSFRIWLQQMTRLPRLDCLGEKDVERLRALLLDAARLMHASYDGGFTLERFGVDPLLSMAIPPSYNFDHLEAKVLRDRRNPYSLSFANQVVTTALHRISQVWPAARLDFDRFVKVVIHLPDLESRSCSAARFAGAILLSSDEDTLLAVEESLVHECGHQILYCVMELAPLIHDDGGRTFTLPWSGSERDAYGYFHALYIYLILALFFERVVESNRNDRREALLRLAAILTGLERAVADFIGADFFTEAGRAFFDRLAKQAEMAIERNRHHIAEAKSLEDYDGPQ